MLSGCVVNRRRLVWLEVSVDLVCAMLRRVVEGFRGVIDFVDAGVISCMAYVFLRLLLVEQGKAIRREVGVSKTG